MRKEKDYLLEYDLEHKDELAALYDRVDREVEKAKSRRTYLVWGGHILAFAVFLFAVLRDISIGMILACTVVCAFLGSVLFWIELSVFNWLFTRNQEDHDRREHIIDRIKKVMAAER